MVVLHSIEEAIQVPAKTEPMSSNESIAMICSNGPSYRTKTTGDNFINSHDIILDVHRDAMIPEYEQHVASKDEYSSHPDQQQHHHVVRRSRCESMDASAPRLKTNNVEVPDETLMDQHTIHINNTNDSYSSNAFGNFTNDNGIQVGVEFAAATLTSFRGGNSSLQDQHYQLSIVSQGPTKHFQRRRSMSVNDTTLLNGTSNTKENCRTSMNAIDSIIAKARKAATSLWLLLHAQVRSL